MKKQQGSLRTDGLLHDLQALLAEAEAVLADSGAEHPTEAVDSVRARLVDARDRFADACARAGRKAFSGAGSALREDRWAGGRRASAPPLNLFESDPPPTLPTHG